MGRHDLRPARVLQIANQLLENKRIRFQPPWLEAIGQLPPSETLVRPVHRFEEIDKVRHNRRRQRKPSKMFQPIELDYPEDKLREGFFNDHPWELARPKVVLEETGNDSKYWDWSRIHQPGKKLDGESVVLRQMWIMENEKPAPGEPSDPISIRERAYDKARKEFYQLRLQQDVERHVAKEEALHYGAYFDAGEIERSLEKEDAAYEDWKKWAFAQVEKDRHKQAGSLPGAATTDEDIQSQEEEVVGAVLQENDTTTAVNIPP